MRFVSLLFMHLAYHTGPEKARPPEGGLLNSGLGAHALVEKGPLSILIIRRRDFDVKIDAVYQVGVSGQNLSRPIFFPLPFTRPFLGQDLPVFNS